MAADSTAPPPAANTYKVSSTKLIFYVYFHFLFSLCKVSLTVDFLLLSFIFIAQGFPDQVEQVEEAERSQENQSSGRSAAF